MGTRHVGRRVVVYDSVPSTNDVAAALASDPRNAGTVVLADHQTSGRGQYGRTWQSRPGASLLMSALVFPPADLRRAVVMTAWATVAVADTVFVLTGVQARIKWPNDLLIRGKKVCGILIEQGSGIVAGVGLNLNQSDDHFAEAGLPDATSLASIAGSPFSTRAVAEAVIRRLDLEYDRLLAGERVPLEADWKWRVGLLGRPVVAELTDGSTEVGRLQDLTFAGAELEVEPGRAVTVPPEHIRQLRPA